MICVGAAHLVFRFLEIGQHVVKTPADIAALPPAVVILVLAAHIKEAVDRARSAQHLAARLKYLPPAEARFWFGLIHPVDGLLLEQLCVAERHVNPDVGIPWARFQQQHGVFTAGAQAIGEHTAGRTRADDDIVEFGSAVIVVHCFPRTHYRLPVEKRGSGGARQGQLQKAEFRLTIKDVNGDNESNNKEETIK